MKFRPTDLPNCFVVESEPVTDDRGHFVRTFDAEEFDEQGIDSRVAQCSQSHSARKGTLRGLHFQVEPYAETKLVRCIRGRIFDVAVDLRRRSHSFARWTAIELSSANHLSLLVPAGFAHGFLTLEDDCDVLYQISTPHVPAAARGVAWDDPTIAVAWPLRTGLTMSEADRSWPTLEALLGSSSSSLTDRRGVS